MQVEMQICPVPTGGTQCRLIILRHLAAAATLNLNVSERKGATFPSSNFYCHTVAYLALICLAPLSTTISS